eukprot:5349367-Prymnesium_polylepis.1
MDSARRIGPPQGVRMLAAYGGGGRVALGVVALVEECLELGAVAEQRALEGGARHAHRACGGRGAGVGRGWVRVVSEPEA